MPRVAILTARNGDAVALRSLLEAEDFVVETIADGDAADARLVGGGADLLLLDLLMPGLPGLEICQRARAREATRTLPIIVVTALDEESHRVRALDAGADDYVVSPYSARELLARIRSLLRKSNAVRSTVNSIAAGDIVMDTDARRVRRGGRDIRLGPLEFAVLEHLIKRPGRVSSRRQLREALWGSSSAVIDRTIDVTIGRLRRALAAPGEADPIRTVRNEGYKFEHE